MAKAKNQVIKGKYINKKIYSNNEFLTFYEAGVDPLRKPYVIEYEIITEEKIKSGTSAILRGAAGVALLGGVGILAGLTAKTNGIYTVAILWKDGERSLIEIDDKLYKVLVKSMF
jgi:hypothetical protein